MKNMPTAPISAPQPTIFDSGLRGVYIRGTVPDFLKEKVQDGSRLSVVSAYFNIYAYDALRSELITRSNLAQVGTLLSLREEELAQLLERSGLDAGLQSATEVPCVPLDRQARHVRSSSRPASEV